MLFVAEYELGWAQLETAAAKRLEWQEVMPDTFRFVGEYVWHNGDPPFRGVAIFETGEADDVHAFVLHYGGTLKMSIFPATDVMSGLATMHSRQQPQSDPVAEAKPRKEGPQGSAKRVRRARRR